MIKYIYGYKDKKIGAFPAYFNEVLDPDKLKVAITRALRSINDIEHLKKFEDLDLYSLGTFNDESGVINSEVVYLLDMSSLVLPQIAALKANENQEDEA